MVDINLDLLNESLERVGKRELTKEDLQKFVIETLKHEINTLNERKKAYENGEIEEIEINDFPFYTDGYRSGILIKITDENIIPFRNEDGDEIQVLVLYKKDKDGQYQRDKNGNLIATDRCLMRLKTRKGFMSVFIGRSKVEELSEGEFYVLVGGLSEQWKVANSEEYHRRKQDGVEYLERPYYTLNVWQIAHITKSGNKVKINLPEVNWKTEENGTK